MSFSYDPTPLLTAAGASDLLKLAQSQGVKVSILPFKSNGKVLKELRLDVVKGVNSSSQTMPCASLSPSLWTKSDLAWLKEIFVGLVSPFIEWGLSSPSDPVPSSDYTKAKPKEKPKKVLSSERVKLEDATDLYQPVFGTDPHSKYFCIGIADGLKVAARINSENVSLKVVGPRIKEIEKQLTALGFSGKEAGHWSAHITCSHTTPSKLIGAVLFGIGVPFQTGMPLVSLIEGKS